MKRLRTNRPHLVVAKYDTPVVHYHLAIPAIDIRHGHNFTGARANGRTAAHFDSHPYWGLAAALYGALTQ